MGESSDASSGALVSTGSQNSQKFLTDVSNRHFSGGNKKYCRTSSEKFIAKVVGWRCIECTEVSTGDFSNTYPPGIAYCGHFIHSKCFTKTERDGTILHFTCKICGEGSDSPSKYDAPLEDKVLADFFSVIRGVGLPCSNQACRKFHAYGNLVHFPRKDNLKEGDTPTYYCVWCAANAPHSFENYKPMCTDKYGKGLDSEMLQNMKSLNRTENSSGWALQTCCICRMEMRNKPIDSQIVHLPCKHIGHKECADKAGKKIECKICGEVCPKENVKERTWHGKYYLDKLEDKFVNCTGRCKQSHPESNFPEDKPLKKCNWCTVESYKPPYFIACSLM